MKTKNVRYIVHFDTDAYAKICETMHLHTPAEIDDYRDRILNQVVSFLKSSPAGSVLISPVIHGARLFDIQRIVGGRQTTKQITLHDKLHSDRRQP